MANEIKIYGVRIYMDDLSSPLTENTDIGLYNVTDEKSEIRWIENGSTEIVETWKSGMILSGGIGAVSRSISLSGGGNVSSPLSFSLSVKNTTLLKDELAEQSISLIGLLAELVLFTDGTESIVATGKIESVEWSEGSFDISVKGNYEDRNCALTKQTDEGDAYPVVFGSGIKTKPIVVDNSYLQNTGSFATFLIPPLFTDYYSTLSEVEKSNTQFLITGFSSATYKQITILISEQKLWDDPTDSTFLTLLRSRFVGKMVEITSGSCNGQCRKIATVENAHFGTGDTATFSYITVTLNEKLTAYPDIEGFQGYSVDSYLRVWNRDTKFYIDSFDSNGIVDGKTYLFSENNFSFVRTEGVDSNGKYFLINNNWSENGIEKISAFLTYGELSFKPSNGYAGKLFADTNYVKVVGGCYKDSRTSNGTYVSSVSSDDYLELVFTPPYRETQTIVRFALCLECEPLQLSDSIAINKTFLLCTDSIIGGIQIDNFGSLGAGGSVILSVGNKKFLGLATAQTVSDFGMDGTYDSGQRARIYCSVPSVSTENFLSPKIITKTGPITDSVLPPSGYSRSVFEKNAIGYLFFDVGINNNDEYNKTKKIFISAKIGFAYTDSSDASTVRSVFSKTGSYYLCFQADVDSDNIFTESSGRLFSDTWGSRKSATDIIAHPIDILEHCLRLANWSEVSAEPTEGWGFAYTAGAKIKLSGVGSFDSAEPQLYFPKNIHAARCISDDYSGSFMLEIARDICREFDLILWVDKDGYYCIERFQPSSTTPSDTITLLDIPFDQRDSIKVTEPDTSQIYCEPFVRYNWNPGSQKYEGLLKITNAASATFSTAYTQGISGEADPENIWNRCHALWNKCRVINEIPSELSDLKFANGADAYDIALTRLSMMVDQMGFSRIEFTCALDSVKGWEEAHRFNVNFPHHTSGNDVECMVEEITYNINENTAFIRAVMFTAADLAAEYSIQNTEVSTFETWQNQETVLADPDTIQGE